MGGRSGDNGVPAAKEGDVAKLRALNALLIAEIAAMRSSHAAGELISPLAKDDDVDARQQQLEDLEVDNGDVVLQVPDDVGKTGVSDAVREKESPEAERTIESGDAAMKILRVEPVDQKKVANDDELSAVTGVESSSRVSAAEAEEKADVDASASLQARLAAMEETLEAADAEKRRALELLGAKEAEAAAASERVAELEKRLVDMKLVSSSAGGVDPKGKQQKKAPAARDRRAVEKKKAPVASVAAATAAPASKVKGKVAAAVSVSVTAPASKVGGKSTAGASGTAAAGQEEEEAGQAQVQEGRPRRTRKPSTRYPEDTSYSSATHPASEGPSINGP